MKQIHYLLVAVLVMIFAVTVLASVPMSLVASAASRAIPGLSYAESEGTIWKGKLSAVTLRGITLGTVTIDVSPMSVLRGGLGGKLSLKGGDLTGSGGFFMSRKSLDIHDAALQARLAPFIARNLVSGPLTGHASMTVRRLAVSRSGCVAADATIETDMLARHAQSFGASGFPLMGTVRCDNKDVVTELAGAGDDGDAQIIVRIKPDQSYLAEVSAKTTAREVSEALALVGFAPKGDRLHMQTTGRLRGS